MICFTPKSRFSVHVAVVRYPCANTPISCTTPTLTRAEDLQWRTHFNAGVYHAVSNERTKRMYADWLEAYKCKKGRREQHALTIVLHNTFRSVRTRILYCFLFAHERTCAPSATSSSFALSAVRMHLWVR